MVSHPVVQDIPENRHMHNTDIVGIVLLSAQSSGLVALNLLLSTYYSNLTEKKGVSLI